MTEDERTIIAARKAAIALRQTADEYKSMKVYDEERRLMDQADWYEKYADRLEARIKEMDNDE